MMAYWGVCHKLRPTEVKRFEKLCETLSAHDAGRQMARKRMTRAFQMHALLGMDMDEVAESLGVSIAMARHLVRKGKLLPKPRVRVKAASAEYV